jgi:4-amino-4-deoxy-L-arabinose transferase-like glycosyltransferase
MKSKYLLVIIVLAFLIRLLPLSFPDFMVEEMRVSSRAYLLSSTGSDEFDRKFPLVFNSQNDYQLPLVTYITSLSIKIFGKGDLAVRLPFIILGTILVYLVILISQVFSKDFKFNLLAGFITAFSPVLIFISRTPNEAILLTFLLCLLFYLLTKTTLNVIFITITILLLLITSKLAWLIVPLFTIVTLQFFRETEKLEQAKYFVISLVLSVAAITLYLFLPEGVRSLKENNFSLFFDIGIKNGIEKLRGQGLEWGWNSLIEKLLFSKLHYLIIGGLHWLSQLNFSTFFGIFDSTGQFSFTKSGALSKILIIPTLIGIWFLIKQKGKYMWLPILMLIITLPVLFVYPNYSLGVVVISVPFLILITAHGLSYFKRNYIYLILTIAIMEIIANFVFFSSEIKSTNMSRPGWVKLIAQDIVISSQSRNTLVSDDVVLDIAPYINWYRMEASAKNEEVEVPYRLRQTQISNIELIGADSQVSECSSMNDLFFSKRDANKFKPNIHADIIYSDSLGDEVVYKYSGNFCINE